MIGAKRSLEGFPWERVQEDLRTLPLSRVSRRRLRETILQSAQCFCVRASVEDILQMFQWWYAMINATFEEMTHDSQILSFSADIFRHNPRLEIRTFYDAPIYHLLVRIEHAGQSSFIPLGEAAVVRRTVTLLDACLTNFDCLQDWVDFLSGTLAASDVTILAEGEYKEIQIGRGRIIVTEDE